MFLASTDRALDRLLELQHQAVFEAWLWTVSFAILLGCSVALAVAYSNFRKAEEAAAEAEALYQRQRTTKPDEAEKEGPPQ